MACGLARFGLVPSWAKDEKISRHTYNARSETASQKPSYRTPWRHRQYGLVVVDNFYEPSYESGRAVRWKIALASGDPFGIACLWDRWRNPATGELVVSFSMLTVNADKHPVMSQFHKPGDEKRTPVIITPDQYGALLSADPAEAVEMLSWAHMPELTALPAPIPSPWNLVATEHADYLSHDKGGSFLVGGRLAGAGVHRIADTVVPVNPNGLTTAKKVIGDLAHRK